MSAMTPPHYEDSSVVLHHGDCLDVLRQLPDASVDSVVTDPPYGLEFMGREWDGADGFRRSLNSADVGRDNAFGRASRTSPEYRAGATFQEWCEAWATECLRVLKPGGHMVAFGGSRTWHRLAAAVEDAGFEIRDSIAWLYGSGFPKSLDVSKAIDKRPGVARHTEFAAHLTERREAKGFSRQQVALAVVGNATGACWNWEHHQFPEAKWWPALRDLLDLDDATWGPVIAEAERAVIGQRVTGIGTGRGAVPVMGDGTRDLTSSTTDDAKRWQGWGTALKPAFEPIVVGRKPLAGTVAANVLAHGTGALNIDACRTEAKDDQLAAKHASVQGAGVRENSVYGTDTRSREGSAPHEGGRWPTNVLLDQSQATSLDEQSGASTSRVGKPRGAASGDGWGMTATGTEYSDSGGASRFFPTFRYEAKAPTHERPNVDGVAHPTVKPLDLMRWLVRLVTPPGGTVLEPFAGSGTTAEACVVEGFRCIAIEREADYLPLIVARLTKPIEIALDFGDVAPQAPCRAAS